MPGTGGSRVIQGVGFWAQQPLYEQQYILLTFGPVGTQLYDLPPAHLVPYRPEYTSFRGPIPLLGFDYGAKIFRGPLRGLPEQPPPPNAFQSWTFQYNPNLIGKDRMLAGEQLWERPTLPPVPAAFTWLQTFTTLYLAPTGRNLNLVGVIHDELPAGQVPPRLEQSWYWRQVGMLGRDTMATGEQVYDLVPSQRPPEQVQLHAWQWSYNLNLIGKDRLPTGDQVTDRPILPVPLYYSHTFQLEAQLAIKGPLGILFNQYDWPLPTPPSRIDQYWHSTFNWGNFDFGAKILRPVWRSLPDLPVQPLLQQSPFPNIVLLTQFAPLNITIAKVWERPTLGIPTPPTWTWSYNLALVGQDKLPFRQSDWPVPIAPLQPALSWTDVTKIWLTAPVRQITIDQYWDRPQLPVPPARSWEWSYNLNLIGQDRLPKGAQVYDRPTLPIPPAQTWLEGPQYELIAKPFAQYDWPNATPNYRLDQTFTASYNLSLIGKDALPVGARSYDLAPTDYQRVLQTWINTVNLSLAQTIGNLYAQARQQDWPNPIPPARDPTLGTWTYSYNLNLRGKDRLPFRQSDWPLTPAAQRQVEASSWIDQVKRLLVAVPFVQRDWPNPTQPSRLEQTIAFNGAIRLPTPTIPAGTKGIFFDRPQLRTDPAADAFFWWSRYPIIPPPPPPTVGGSYRLLTDHYLYGVYYKPNTIITEGVQVPMGWVPTLAVDPLDALAVAAYYAAGPRHASYEDVSTYTNMYKREFADVPVNSPVTFWKQVPGTSTFQLTGLGTGRPPVGG